MWLCCCQDRVRQELKAAGLVATAQQPQPRDLEFSGEILIWRFASFILRLTLLIWGDSGFAVYCRMLMAKTNLPFVHLTCPVLSAVRAGGCDQT